MNQLLERLRRLPEEKRTFALNELAEHLAMSGKTSDLMRLLLSNNEWLEAKFSYLKNDSSYMHDLDVALQGFEDPLPADQMPTLGTLNTAKHVVGQRASAYNDFDLQTLVWLNRSDEALATARLRTNSWARLKGLLSTHAAIVECWGSDANLLDEICALTREITYAEDRAAALRATAVRCAEHRDPRADAFFAEAIQAALAINDILRGPHEQEALANTLVQFRRFDQAQQVALAIKDDPLRRKRALNTLVEALSTEGRHSEAAVITRLLAAESKKTISAQKTSNPAQGRTLITTDAGMELLAGTTEDNKQANDLEAAVDKSLEDGRFDAALTAARAIRISARQARALSRIAVELARSNRAQATDILEEAREVALAAENLSARITVLGRLSTLVDDPPGSAELHRAALELVDGNEKPLKRASALLELASVLLLAQDERAHPLIDQARQIVVEAAVSSDRDVGLDQVVRTLTRAGRTGEAEALISEMRDDFNRANALTSMGRFLFEQGDPQATDMLKKARRETDALVPHGIGPTIGEQEPALSRSYLAAVLTLAGESDADVYFDKALASVDDLQDYYSWCIGLGALIESLYKVGRNEDAEDLRTELPIFEMESSISSYKIEAYLREKRFTEAIQLIKDVQEEQYRQYSLAMIAEQLVKDGHPVQGLSILGARTADEFLSILANYTVPLDKALFRELLFGCIHIAAWITPFWKRIEQMLLQHSDFSGESGHLKDAND